MKNFLHVSRSAAAAMVFAALLAGGNARHAFAADSPAPTPGPSNVGPGGIPGLLPLGPDTSGTSAPPAPLTHGISVSAGATNPDSGIGAPGVVGRADDIEITVSDLRAVIETLDPEEQAAMAADPALVRRALLSLLVERLVMREVDAKKWDRQPDIQARLDRVRKTTTATLYLKSVSEPPADYPSEAELKSAYETRKTIYNIPHQVLLSQIFVSIKPADKVQSKLEAIHKSLMEPGADFAAIARDKSDDPKGAAQGGSMGWLPSDKLPPRIRFQALTLPKNAVSDPIRLDDGWHIIKVMDVKDVSPMSFDEVKKSLAQQLRTERAKADREAYIGKLLQKNQVKIDDEALPQVMAAAPAQK